MNTHLVNTAMREAFINAEVSPYIPQKNREIHRAARARAMLHSNAGVMKVRDWNAALSFKTAQLIGIKEGCTNPHARMPYDEML